MYANSDPFLHAHVFPRYASEPDKRRRQPVRRYPPEMWREGSYGYGPIRHGALRAAIADALQELLRAVGRSSAGCP